jgi:signal transduction histidine kinase
MEEANTRIEERLLSRRLVAASDAERQRIERVLHDGTQQHLIALCVNLQLARHLLRTDLDAAEGLLESVRADAREALEALRGIAHDVYPPLLAERGADVALRVAAGEADGRFRVKASLGRHDPDVEATVYFSCVDALRRLAGRPGPAQASIRTWEEPHHLRFEVTDEIGADASWCKATVAAVGDRVAALGGRLTVASTSAGSRLSGRIPIGPPDATPLPRGTRPRL